MTPFTASVTVLEARLIWMPSRVKVALVAACWEAVPPLAMLELSADRVPAAMPRLLTAPPEVTSAMVRLAPAVPIPVALEVSTSW